MTQRLKISLEKLITSAKVLEPPATGLDDQTAGSPANLRKQLEAQNAELEECRHRFEQLCRALEEAANKINVFQEKLVKDSKTQIAKLSVEIARKILKHQIEKGNYDIAAIIQEALNSTPAREDVTIHLNTEDLNHCRRLQQENPQCTLANVKLVVDSNIHRAECMLETPRGVVESLIENQLERIGEALRNTE